MSLFENFGTEGLEESRDYVGREILDSDIYNPCKIKLAYVQKSQHGAMNVTFVINMPNGQEFRETVYISNRAGQNYYVRDGKKNALPGFTLVNDIALLTTGKELKFLNTEEKVVKVYDFDEKKEVPRSLPCIVDMHDKEVALAILRVLQNKQKKGDDGQYYDTEEEMEINTIDKALHSEFRVTVNEARKQQKEPEFWNRWVSRNRGKTRDKRSIKGGSGSGGSGSRAGTSGPPQPGAGKKTPDLFGD